MLVNLKVDQLAKELVNIFVTELIKKNKINKEKQVKVRVLNKYYKDRDNLKIFLLQCNLYM